MALIAVAVLALRGGTLLAQDVTEVALKAAFLYNFAKFTVWPPDVLPEGAPLAACVMGDTAVGEALERTVQGRLVDGHAISVSLVTVRGPLPPCHLLYVSGMAARQAAQIVGTLKDTPVLTISDLDEFARRGGVAQFFVENGKMRFGINLASVKRSRLQLSSKLLALARLVDDESLASGTGTRRGVTARTAPYFSSVMFLSREVQASPGSSRPQACE